MKKILVSSVAALVLTSSALMAEESGLFVGIGTGYGQSEIKTDSTKQKLDGVSFETLLDINHFLLLLLVCAIT